MLCGRNWVVDGGLGSVLQDVFPIMDDPLWSARLLATHPNAIKEVHKSYLEAGAEIVTTSSYQASINGFCEHLGADRNKALEYMELSVRLAKEAIEEYYAQLDKKGPRPLIAGSVGPFGACQADRSEYTGEYVTSMSEDELIEWHKPRMTALINAGVDLLAIETIPSLKEALAVIKLLHTFPNTKAWVTFSCKDGQHTNYGDDFGNAVKQCYEEGGQQVVGIGINCTPPQHIASLLKQANLFLPPAIVLPRVVYSDSGEKWIEGKGWNGRSQECPFISKVQEWISLGASVIGGCCRVGSTDIKSIANIVASPENSQLISQLNASVVSSSSNDFT